MVVAMMNAKGPPNVVFQVNCLRLLNSLLNLCRSANMRVFLQHEMEEAGFNCDKLIQNCHGDGLEFDDLKKEIKEWKTRYIDVTSLLRKIRIDMKKDCKGSMSTRPDFDYDQQSSSQYSAPLSEIQPYVNSPKNAGQINDHTQGETKGQIQGQTKGQPQGQSQGRDQVLKQSTSSQISTSTNSTTTNTLQYNNLQSFAPSSTSEGHYDVITVTSDLSGQVAPRSPLNSAFTRTAWFASSLAAGTQTVDQNWAFVHKSPSPTRQNNRDCQKTKISNSELNIKENIFDSGVDMDEYEHMYANNRLDGETLPADGSNKLPDDTNIIASNLTARQADAGPLMWYNPGIQTKCHKDANRSTNKNNLNKVLPNMNGMRSAFSKPSRPPSPPPDYNLDSPKLSSKLDHSKQTLNDLNLKQNEAGSRTEDLSCTDNVSSIRIPGFGGLESSSVLSMAASDCVTSPDSRLDAKGSNDADFSNVGGAKTGHKDKPRVDKKVKSEKILNTAKFSSDTKGLEEICAGNLTGSGQKLKNKMDKTIPNTENHIGEKEKSKKSKGKKGLKGTESVRSYSEELGKVLGDLDFTLENNGLRSSMMKDMKIQRPFIAYV